MGTALKFLRELLEKIGLELDRKTATSLLVLLALLILLPVGIFLSKSDLNFLPRADGELISLSEGGCIKLDKNKKKVVDCATVPLKLINPFYNIKASLAPSKAPSASPSHNPSSAASPSNNNSSPTPTPSSTSTAQNCATSASSGTELLTAVNCYKNAGIGGKITLPAGTIEVNEKISVPSNVTIKGAGMNSTIIRMSGAFERKTSPSSDGDDALMANDSSHGQQNVVLRDFTLQGDGQRSGNSCCYGLKLQNISNSFVVNVKVDSFGIDGIFLGQRPNKPGATRVRLTGCTVTNNGRSGISIVDGETNVVDHCTISGNSANELVAGIDLEPDNGNTVSNNHIFENNISGNRNNGIQIMQNPNDPGGLVLNNFVCNNSFSGNNGTDFDDKGFGTSTSGCTADDLNPPSASLMNPVFHFLSKIWNYNFIDQALALGLAPALQNSPYKDKLVSYWKFDETSGNAVADTNFQRQDGTGTAANTTIVDGKFGKARMIPSGGSISIPNYPEFGDRQMSISAWVKPGSFPGGAAIWSQPEGTSVVYAPEGNGNLVCAIKPIRENQVSDFSVRSNGGDVVTANAWNHVACTFDENNLKLFINGRLVAQGSKSGWLNKHFDGQPVFIGKDINGAIDDTAYWNRALSDSEVASIYNGGQGQTIDLAPPPTSTSTPTLAPSVAANTPTPTPAGSDNDDQFLIADASPGSSVVQGNGIVKYRLAESQAGLSSAPWKDFVLLRNEHPSFAEKIWNVFSEAFKPVFAQDSDDNFTGTSGDDSNDQFVTGSPGSSGSSGGPASSGSPSFSVGKQFITTNFQLTDATPGPKQIWVQYMHPDGTTRVDHTTFDLVDKTPQITGLTCNLDISKQNLKITVDGNYFGTTIGKVTIVSPSGNTEVTSWNNKQITSLLKNPNVPANEGQRFQIKVVRDDGFESPTAVCAVDKSLISLGARIFCREPGKFDAKDVLVTLLYNNDDTPGTTKVSKVEEKVTINADGEISTLKTALQTGKSYVLSIKAPGSLRRTTTFTAAEGTTQITKPDGTPFILPVGDIAPVINPDGTINSVDRAELIRQWRILGSKDNSKVTGDFNRDTKVNSIDWACMQYDFGSSDDPLPVEVPGSNSGTITIPKSNSGTITIPVRSPTP